MKAGVEWVVGVIRVGPDYKQHGDSFDFACTVIRRGDEAELIGAVTKGEFTLSHAKAIRTALRELGIKKVHWDRVSGKSVDVVDFVPHGLKI